MSGPASGRPRRGSDDESENDQAPREEFGSAPTQYFSNNIVLDMHGGDQMLGEDKSLKVPGEVLLLDDEGSLVARREMEEKQPTRLGRGQTAVPTDDTSAPSGGETQPGSTGSDIHQWHD